MSLTMTDLMPRVDKGAAWLDVNQPGWFDRIDLDRLDMSTGDHCVFGQCYGDYGRGLTVALHTAERYALKGVFAFEHGLHVNELGEWEEDRWSDWSALKECWATVILQRRFAALDAQQAEAAVDPVDRIAELTPVHAREVC